VVVSLGLLLIIARTANSIASERASECWDSLLLTRSLTPSEIIWSKILGGLYPPGRGLDVWPLVSWSALSCGRLFLLVLPFEILTVGIVASPPRRSECLVRCISGIRCGPWRRRLFTAIFFGGGVFLFCCMSCLIAPAMSRGGEHLQLLVGVVRPFPDRPFPCSLIATLPKCPERPQVSSSVTRRSSRLRLPLFHSRNSCIGVLEGAPMRRAHRAIAGPGANG